MLTLYDLAQNKHDVQNTAFTLKAYVALRDAGLEGK